MKSEFVAKQFIFLLPALWMLSAEVSDKHFPCQNKSNLSSFSCATFLCMHARVPVELTSHSPSGPDGLVSMGPHNDQATSPGATSKSRLQEPSHHFLMTTGVWRYIDIQWGINYREHEVPLGADWRFHTSQVNTLPSEWGGCSVGSIQQEPALHDNGLRGTPD